MGEALDLIPVRTTASDDTIEYSFFALVNKTTMKTLNQLNVSEKSVFCQIKNHEEEPSKRQNVLITVDANNFDFCDFPLFESIMGKYSPIIDTIEDDLNNECDLKKVSDLFVGSLLYIEDIVLLIITAETYSRDVVIDAHAENNSDSFPESIDRNSRHYKIIKVIIKEESQGKQTMKKLIIGTTKFNILVTCSLLLTPRSDRFVTVGPSCHEAIHNLNVSQTQILFRKSSIEGFYKQPTGSQPEVTACRQLMSAFDHKSTYFVLRSSLFNNPNMQPMTVFTVGNVPTNDYGMSVYNKARLVSTFFKTIGTWIINDQIITSKDIQKLKDAVEDNENISKIVISLENEYNTNGKTDIMKFLGKQKGLSSLAQSLSSNISTANKKIEKDIMSYFATHFGKK